MTVLGFGVAISQPAEFALVPAAAGPETDAARANGLMETVRSLGFTAGPLVGGALGAAGLLWLALALNALSFVIVAAAALLLRARREPQRTAGAKDPVRARDGFGFFLRERELVITLGGAVAALVLFSMSATAEPFFVTRVLGGGSLAYGLLLSSWTVGMAAGSAGLAHRVGRAQLAAGGLAAIVLQGLGIAGGALATVVWTALIGFSLGGVAHGVKNVLLRTLIHERAPEALRGRAFAAYNGARNGAELGALVLGGIVVSAIRRPPRAAARGRRSGGDRRRLPTASHQAPPRRGGGHHSTKGEFSMHTSKNELEPDGHRRVRRPLDRRGRDPDRVRVDAGALPAGRIAIQGASR